MSVRLESSRCLLGSGPEGVVLNIVKSDGSNYQQCTLARAALTRRWPGNDASRFHAPQPLHTSLRHLRKAHRALARTQRGSSHRRHARHALARVHAQIAHQRQAWHWELAQALCATYDTIYLEDLELRGMAALWGRKVATLGFGQFVQILHAKAHKTGVDVHHINRFFPSTKLCHVCGTLNASLTLRDRVWTCAACGTTHKRTTTRRSTFSGKGRLPMYEVPVRPARRLPPSACKIPRASVVGVRQRPW